MERLATELGIAKGTLYLYFPGKQDLFFACVDLGMQQMQSAIRDATSTIKEPLEMVATAISTYLTFFDEHPYYVELIIQERANFKDRKRPTYFEHRDANRGPWRQLYTDMVAAGTLRNDVAVEQMLDAVGNMIYGTMFTNLFIGRKVSLEEQSRSIYEIAMRGITRQLATSR